MDKAQIEKVEDGTRITITIGKGEALLYCGQYPGEIILIKDGVEINEPFISAKLAIEMEQPATLDVKYMIRYP